MGGEVNPSTSVSSMSSEPTLIDFFLYDGHDVCDWWSLVMATVVVLVKKNGSSGGHGGRGDRSGCYQG